MNARAEQLVLDYLRRLGEASRHVLGPQERSTFERSRLDWSEVEREPHRGLLAWHRRLLALRRATPELRAGGPLSVEQSEAPRRLVMSRGPVRVDCDFATGRVAVEKLGKPLKWE